MGTVRWAEKRHPESEEDKGKVDTKKGTQRATERSEKGQGKKGKKADELKFFKSVRLKEVLCVHVYVLITLYCQYLL